MNDNTNDNIVNLGSSSKGNNLKIVPGSDKAKPPKHTFEVTFLDGSEMTSDGYLSVGPIFCAVVDENDLIEDVFNTSEVKKIHKGVVVPDSVEANV